MEISGPTLILLELFVILPPILYLLIHQISIIKSVDKKMLISNINPDVLLIFRVWSTVFFFLFIISHLESGPLTFPFSILSISLVFSSLFINRSIPQAVFHCSSTLSWFGLFEIFSRSWILDEEIDYFTWKMLTSLFMTTSMVFRVNIGQPWQFRDVSMMSIGVVILLFYFWGVELPLCTLMQARQNSCLYFYYDHPQLTGEYGLPWVELHLSPGGRVGGVLATVMLHLAFGQVMLFFITSSSSLEDEPAGDGKACEGGDREMDHQALAPGGGRDTRPMGVGRGQALATSQKIPLHQTKSQSPSRSAQASSGRRGTSVGPGPGMGGGGVAAGMGHSCSPGEKAKGLKDDHSASAPSHELSQRSAPPPFDTCPCAPPPLSPAKGKSRSNSSPPCRRHPRYRSTETSGSELGHEKEPPVLPSSSPPISSPPRPPSCGHAEIHPHLHPRYRGLPDKESDRNKRAVSLPPPSDILQDGLAISEEEAIRIVYNELLFLKSKRAT